MNFNISASANNQMTFLTNVEPEINSLSDHESTNQKTDQNLSLLNVKLNGKSSIKDNSSPFQIPERASSFTYIVHNEYKCNISKSNFFGDESTRCECHYDSTCKNVEIQACGEKSDCINRLLLVECDDDCPSLRHCQNKRYVKLALFDERILLSLSFP